MHKSHVLAHVCKVCPAYEGARVEYRMLTWQGKTGEKTKSIAKAQVRESVCAMQIVGR